MEPSGETRPPDFRRAQAFRAGYHPLRRSLLLEVAGAELCARRHAAALRGGSASLCWRGGVRALPRRLNDCRGLDPDRDVSGMEAKVVAPLEKGDPPLGDQASNVPDRHSKDFGDLVDVKKPRQLGHDGAGSVSLWPDAVGTRESLVRYLHAREMRDQGP